MTRKIVVLATAVVALAVLGSALPLFAQDSQAPPSGTAQVVVTARANHGTAPVLTARDVTVHEDKHPEPVVNIVPINRADSPLELVILIDSDSTIRLGAQFQDVSQFVQALPENASVALAYALNGSARLDQPFTTDRAVIAKALHVTLGPSAGNTSIYAALSDLVQKWPGGSGTREVLLLSDGIDPTYGLFDTQPDQNPGLQAAVRNAQKSHVTVFSIFVGAGRITRNQLLDLNGQGSLDELTSDTGGYSFSQGTQTPVSLRPFLADLERMLGQQYLLTFGSTPEPKAGYHDLKVNTELSGVKLFAPKRVYDSRPE